MSLKDAKILKDWGYYRLWFWRERGFPICQSENWDRSIEFRKRILRRDRGQRLGCDKGLSPCKPDTQFQNRHHPNQYPHLRVWPFLKLLSQK